MVGIRNSLVLLSLICFLGCGKPKSATVAAVVTTASNYLYLSSGVCHSGGSLATYTAATSSNQILRINAATGVKDVTLADYTASPSQLGDTPTSILNADSSSFYVLVDNATTSLRRIEKVSKSFNGSRSLVYFATGTTGANSFKSLALNTQNDFLIARTSAIEKVTATGSRITSGTLAFVVPPTTGGCAMPTGGTLTQTIALPNGMIAFTNASSGTLAKVSIVAASGYASAANCVSSAQTPSPAAGLPTAMAFDTGNSILLVAFAGYSPSSTSKVNTIYAYGVNTTSGTLGLTPTRIYDQTDSSFSTFLYGISAMALDVTNGHLYVSSSVDTAATSTGYLVEKFTYTPANITGTLATSALVRVGTTPFFNSNLETRCISDMFVAD